MANVKKIKQYYFTSADIMGWTGNSKILDQKSEIQSYLITQVGIQGLPGLRFSFGTGKDMLVLNGLGFFDLDLTGTGAYVPRIEIDVASAQSRAKNNPKGYIIIDLVLTPVDAIEENGGVI